MKIYDIYKRVLILIGEEEIVNMNTDDSALKNRFLTALNEIAEDITGLGVNYDMYSEIALESSAVQALTYGSAMLLSLESGQTETNRIFCELYNSKRAAYMGKTGNIINSIPTV